jgi:hypothetical protein
MKDKVFSKVLVQTQRIVLLVILGLCGPAVVPQQGGFVAKASTSCDTVLTSGSGATLEIVCISNEGNLVRFESPSGFEQIGQSDLLREGYAICSGNLPTFPNTPEGYDDGDVSEEGLFGPATVIQPGGTDTLPLTIVRTTTSGTYELTQSFARDTLERSLIITMTIKRLNTADCTSAGCPPVRLQRAFAGGVDNVTSTNAAFARSVDSVWEWIDPGSSDSNATTGHGLHLSNVANGGATPITTVYTRSDYDPKIVGADSAGGGCVVYSGQLSTPTNPASVDATTLVGRLMYFFNSIPLNHSETVKVVYERF